MLFAETEYREMGAHHKGNKQNVKNMSWEIQASSRINEPGAYTTTWIDFKVLGWRKEGSRAGTLATAEVTLSVGLAPSHPA